MSQEKELEIQMQFLEEATDYLNTLEGVLLEIDASNRIDLDKINGALRAAHSIKGGAGMMGFRMLSDLAHRLEDSFKVLKTRKNSLEIDTQLQSLLLSGVDWLRQIVELLSEGNVIEEEWLATFCYPVFDELHERLGDPSPEDATTMLSPEDGQDIIPLLFETEVEGCLQRLESVLLDSEQPCLQEEVSIMAAELGGLGEMLQLAAFTQLCESVTYHLTTAAPHQIAEISQLALQAWRRSQALVLTNQMDSLPTAIEFSAPDVLSTAEAMPTAVLYENPSRERGATIAEFLATDTAATHPIETEIVAADVLESAEGDESWLDEKIIAASFASLEAEFADDIDEQVEFPELTTADPEISPTDYRFVERKSEPVGAGKERETPENTVRVPSKQLEQINDLFGELIIQRNGLNLQMERLRKLVRNLSQRVQVLDRENQELRAAYDKISTQATASSGISSEHNWQTSNHQTQGIENGFDALEMDRYSELNLLSQEVMETIVQVQEVTTDVQLSVDDTDQIARKLSKTSKQLQTKLTQVRMRPLSDLIDRFPRALRDLNLEYGKNVQLKVEGGNTLIERSILEALNEPLMHLVRNAFDHGIEDAATRRTLGKPEQGVIEIKATHRSNRTLITMRDDGRGISLDKIRDRALTMGLDASLLAGASDEELLSLIFEPGFTTSDQVTALSGRGVGMDVVRNNLKLVRGEIKVDTQPGVGTTFTLSVPFTLSVARVLLVETNRMLLAFPTDVISEIFLLQNEQVFAMAGSEVINWQGTMVPLIRIGRYLEFNGPRYNNPDLETPAAINANSVLIVKSGNQPVAVQVDRCWGEQEVAIRQIEGDIPLPEGFNNCTILGDGRVVPLVNTNELLYWIATNQRTPRSNQLPSARLKTAFLVSHNEKLPTPPANQKGTILIVDDSINVRRFLALTLEKGGYQVEQAKDGQDALDKLQSGLQVQAVICDIEMPRLDGYGFLGRVKSNVDMQDIPVAMLTSRSSAKHRQLAIQLGARAYFSKPYNEQELLRTLEEIIFSINGTLSSHNN
ncbi:response regulator [Calothrix sp. PCC 7507]|uniref:hybrid sensor histidine kinase/response regulator n=1 Tax=Calothrix sp. PCC 7507 TaxID=99598 RepID=UPI00029F00E9|nr:response regulator [Calothrix sp. PCC 7507]AFY34048.1 CheA signal transduction histidine kinase [Calothrix sp. PCC 7507]